MDGNEVVRDKLLIKPVGMTMTMRADCPSCKRKICEASYAPQVGESAKHAFELKRDKWRDNIRECPYCGVMFRGAKKEKEKRLAWRSFKGGMSAQAKNGEFTVTKSGRRWIWTFRYYSESETRSGLLWEVERLLTETKSLPQVLLMENVPQVIGAKAMPDFAQWIAFLDELGYKSKYALLNAKDYGIPQNRERCFMVSILGDYFYEFPAKMPLLLKPIDLLEENVARKYFVSEKTKKAIIKTLGRYSHFLTDAPISTIVSRYGRNYRGTVILYYDYNSRVKEDQNSICCVTTNTSAKAIRNGQKIIVNGNVRIFTPKEVWRFMGFADADIDNAVAVGISDSQLFKQGGNSIAVQVLEAIFKQML